jgi:hypothetical protein
MVVADVVDAEVVAAGRADGATASSAPGAAAHDGPLSGLEAAAAHPSAPDSGARNDGGAE